MRSSTIAEMNLSKPEIEAVERSLLTTREINKSGTRSEPTTSEIHTRVPKRWEEPLTQFPQNIFLIRIGTRTVVGRKLMSVRHTTGELLELHCSSINASHILGEFDGFRQSESEITIDYFPYTQPERRWVIEAVANEPMTEVIFPFVYLADGRERTSPPDGWSLDEERAENLGRGESNLRRFSHNVLRALSDGPHTLYDPACSTGQFLYELKAGSSRYKTVGQDLSAEMTAYARDFVDQVYHGDAAEPAIPNESASVVFCRFLNSEVVSTASARKLLNRLQLVVAHNGLLVVFGHTPVLVRASDITQDRDFQLIRCNGYDPSRTSIFQFYVARRLR